MTKVADFIEYKKRTTPGVVYLGDSIEWLDWDGTPLRGTVMKIEHKPLAGHSFYESMECLPIWEKEDYIIHLDNGISIVGDILHRKIIHKASDSHGR